MHLIGLEIKKMNDIKWVADFRDPWSNWDILDLFHLSKRARNKHIKMEQEVVKSADAVISVSKNWAADLHQSYDRTIQVITNGYDHEDFVSFQPVTEGEFRMLHAGLLNSYRNSRSLWQVLEELLHESNEFSGLFKLVLAGNVTDEVIQQIRSFPMLSERTITLGYIDHEKLKEEYKKSSVLLLLQNDTNNSSGHIPAKVFEYLATGIPICAIGSQESDLNDIIRDFNPIGISRPQDSALQKANILKVFQAFLDKKILSKPKDPKDFQRINLTKKLSELLDTLDTAKT